jgi:hypothetical protein
MRLETKSRRSQTSRQARSNICGISLTLDWSRILLSAMEHYELCACLVEDGAERFLSRALCGRRRSHLVSTCDMLVEELQFICSLN